MQCSFYIGILCSVMYFVDFNLKYYYLMDFSTILLINYVVLAVFVYVHHKQKYTRIII